MQIHDLPEQTTIADADQFALDTGTTTRKTPFSLIKDTIKTYALKFSSLTAQTTASTSDVFPIDSGSGAKKITFSNLITSIFNRNISVNGTLSSNGIDCNGGITMHSTATKGTTPSGSIYTNINIQDSQSGSSESNRLACFRSYIDTSDVSHAAVVAYKPTSGSTSNAYFRINNPASGSADADLTCSLNLSDKLTANNTIRVEKTDSSESMFKVKNSLHEGNMTINASGTFALVSVTNQKTMIQMNSDGIVKVCTADGGMLRPVGTSDTDGRRVKSLDHASSTTLRVYGQKGTAGADYSGYTTFTGTASSDIRLKRNIKNAEVDGLPLINAIDMKAFDWKPGQRDYTHQPIGMIADQIEKLDGRLVIGGGYDPDGTPNYKVIDDHYLICYLVKAVQELSAEVEELRRAK